MAIPEIIAEAKRIDVADLVGRYVSLTKVSGNEFEGPCPKCGGDDRLHCSTDWWFCRQCHDKRGDAIDFMRHATGCTFQEATEKLTNQPWPERKAHVQQPKAQRPDDRSEEWFESAAKLMRLHQRDLPGSEGASYLRGRGLSPDTWSAFGLGFTPNAKYPGATAGSPAIAMPWVRGGKLTAIRYRFLNPTGKHKLTSLTGSKFGGALFGGQAIPAWVHMPLQSDYRGAERHCTLVLCEGELNAMSIWQVSRDTNLHVMSLGSETARLSDGAIAVAKRYGRVIIWMDREELARELMGQVGNAHACYSPDGKDANDLLQMGILGKFLVEQRWLSTRSDHEQWQLIFDLWDAANEGAGLEGGTAAAYAKLCDRMGRMNDLVERGGVWVTAQRLQREKA